jgi:hypothetical protein
MKLLEDIFKQYYDNWFYAYTQNHKEKSFIRFMEIRTRGKTTYIKVFSYYPKTGKVDYFKLSNLNHLSWLDVIEDIDKETEETLNTLYVKSLLTQRDEYVKDAF